MNTNEKPERSALGWLGLRDRISSIMNSQSNLGPGSQQNFQQGRRELLNQISSFLLAHQLGITPNNLVIAYEAFSGANPNLARQIARRIAAGLDITQQWLDEATATDNEKRDDSVQILVEKLESTLEIFSRNTSAARSVTSDYSDELEQHVLELVQVQEAGSIVSSFANLAKAMLERTRKLEADMRRSEDEVLALRTSLEKAKRDAEIDHLTGLPNRRAFEAVLEREHLKARVELTPLVVAFCDIDHFKRVNDTHGHEAGDRVIRLFANTLSGISNDHCHVARHGGEEFAVLFCGTPLSEAHRRLDEVRNHVAERRLINRKTGQALGQITFSAGISDVFDYPDTRAALMAADEALYGAKEGGRNQVFVAAKPTATV